MGDDDRDPQDEHEHATECGEWGSSIDRAGRFRG